jgi:ABC-type transport system substrate-binding protein
MKHIHTNGRPKSERGEERFVPPRRSSRARPLTAVLAVAFLVAACGSSSSGGGAQAGTTAAGGTAPAPSGTSAGGGAPSGEVKAGMAKGDLDTLDPNRWYFAATWGLANGLCTTLVRYDDKAGQDGVKIVPGLADMPEVSSDGLTYTFKLRSAKFANGDPITPADVKYTFERLMAPDVDTGTGGYFGGVVGVDDYTSGKATEISGITTTADSVVFKLSVPDGSFLNKVALPTTCPVGQGAPKKPDQAVSLLQKYASGPYTVDSYTPEQSMVWVRNPNYDASALGDRGKAAKISFEIGVDPSQAALKIKAGDIDVYTGNFPTADITTLSNDASLKSQTFKADRPAILTLFLNNTVAPFDNVKVRQAVNYAVNRTQIQRVWGGPQVGTPTDQILPPSVPQWSDYDAYPFQPDLEKAKQLITESGIKTPVTTQLRTRNDVAGFMEVSQVVQANLKAIGINVEIQGAPGSVDGAYDADAKNKAPMGLVTFSMDFPDGQAFINLLLDPAKPDFGGSYARFNDKSFIPYYDKVAGLTGEERDKAYIALDEKIMTEAAPWAPLLVPSRFDFVSSRLTGYTYSQAMDAVNYNTIGVSS